MNIDNTTPLVSVIMPAYNAAEFIEEAIDSVISQTITDWELLVIDDCSKDETAKIVEEIAAHDGRVRLLPNETNMGAASSRNRGLDIFRGQYVAFLDSDDYWYPQMLEKMIARAEETKADIIYCSYEIVDESGKKLCNDFIVPEKTSFEESIIRSVILVSMTLITKNFAKSHKFPTNVYHEDIALWFSVLRDGCTACGVSEVMAAYRQSANTKSSNKFKSAVRRWNLYRNYLKMPLLQSVYTMLRYAYYGIIKYKRA